MCEEKAYLFEVLKTYYICQKFGWLGATRHQEHMVDVQESEQYRRSAWCVSEDITVINKT